MTFGRDGESGSVYSCVVQLAIVPNTVFIVVVGVVVVSFVLHGLASLCYKDQSYVTGSPVRAQDIVEGIAQCQGVSGFHYQDDQMTQDLSLIHI